MYGRHSDYAYLSSCSANRNKCYLTSVLNSEKLSSSVASDCWLMFGAIANESKWSGVDLVER